MWNLLIPCAGTFIYELMKKRSLPRYFFHDLCMVSGYVLAYSFFFIPTPLAVALWIPLSLYQLLRWYFLFRFQIPLSIQLMPFLRNPRCFYDSIKALPLLKLCFLGILLIGSSLYAFLSSPTLFLWILIFIFSAIASFAKSKHKKATHTDILPNLSFPHDLSIPISPNYPALRKTLAFIGEKKFPISLHPEEKPNIIFLFLESFRAKNIGCLGSSLPASPQFDAWAKKGLLFRNFHANGLQTFRALLSAYFGIPAHLRTISLKPFCDIPLHGLPQILKNHGYHPAVIQSGDLSFDHLYPFFKSHGFETILGGENIPTKTERRNSWGIDDECMVRFAANWLEKQSKPTFLSLFTITNHHPWKSPLGWEFQTPQNLPPVYRNFLQTFAYTDHCLGLFLDLLDQKKLLDKSILLIAGDHGQEMGERRPFSELNHSLFEENIHLPLLILGEGKNLKPSVCNQAASFIDFLPTILDLLNIQDIHHSVGRSLLRNISTPSYFSLQREDTEIGSIHDKTKIIITPTQIMKFDLEKDPEEKSNIAQSADPLGSDAISYFRSIETIYNLNAWTPKPTIPYQIKATDSMNDTEWLHSLHNHPPISVVDLSSSNRLTDQAILKADPKYAAAWHRLTLANCSRLTDLSLKWIGSQCENLMSLNLSYCHLITDQGVQAILAQCTHLRHLWLDGIEDLSDFVPQNTLFQLQTCSMKEATNIQGNALTRIFLNAPHLIDWSASFKSVTNEQLLEMSRLPKRCTHMAVSQGTNIQDHALNALLSCQEDLQEVHIEEFPQLANPCFSKQKKLRYLDISDCIQLTDAFFESVRELPLIYLRIHNCPKITKRGLYLLRQKPNFSIFLSGSSGIEREEIQSLRAQGVHIY